ncbi:MAG: hypothetical protein EHM45_20815 [Desulfobacteraceae bacterium]|nr:MAG: hypothetical protein EHM45_20815 [Desulfobacteraceae bacterium]
MLLGIGFMAGGSILALVGFFLWRKFDPPRADVGRFQPAGPPLKGLAAFLGLILLIFGLSAVMVGVMVMFF